MLVEGCVMVSIQFFHASRMYWKNQKGLNEEGIPQQHVFIPAAGNVFCCATNMFTGICCSMGITAEKDPGEQWFKGVQRKGQLWGLVWMKF
jgi:hypothetical protein